MVLTEDEVAQQYPLHWLVWNNKFEDLKASLSGDKHTTAVEEELEAKDPRGRTPLMLAVTLNHIDCVKVLIEAGADVNCEKDGWTAVQEATATGDMELLSFVLSHRDYQRHVVRCSGIPELLDKLSLAPDFYVEMKWEFTSWVPLVSRMCPFDTYKVYKRGGNVRVDTTLVGFHQNKWQRGDKTYIFTGQGEQATLMELDHERRTAWSEEMVAGRGRDAAPPPPPRAALAARLAAPLAINYLDTDKISFERNKSGIWGWRQDKTENVQGYECKVFSANNVELVSKTRSEHLPKGERRPQPKAPLAGLLALADADRSEGTSPLLTPDKEEEDPPPPTPPRPPSPFAGGGGSVCWQQYFSDEELQQDIGRQQDVATKVQKFKANLWLCEDYPLQLQEQIMPILDLMTAISSPHFAKLKDFIQMQLPSGFPVKIEIPLFHVLNARITFGNIFATETPIPHIECIQEGDRLSCVVDDACFAVGREYSDEREHRPAADAEEGLLQYAIQQSLMQPGTHDDRVDVWEALRGARPVTPTMVRLNHEESLLQRAIVESLACISISERMSELAPPAADAELDAAAPELGGADPELAAALALSVQEQQQRDRLLRDEQAALDEALRLSLIDK